MTTHECGALYLKEKRYRLLLKLWEKERKAEERFNPNHDPKTGRFTSGAGLDKSAGSGIIEAGSDSVAEIEQEYGVSYGVDSADADMEYINSDKYAEKFNNITDNANVNNTLLECSRAAIKHRNGTLYEDMYIIDGNSGSILAVQLNASQTHGIDHTKEMNSAIARANAKNIPIIALHTHPEGFPPSADDFDAAFKYNYTLGIVAGHNGQVYTYKNFENAIEKEVADDIHFEISARYTGGVDIDRAYKEVYQLFGLDYNIIS